MNVYTISLGFNRPSIIEQSIAQYRATQSGLLSFRHIILDQHYPLANKQENSLRIKEIADRYGCEYMNAGQNLGLHKGWNWVCERLPLKDEDIIIGYDPDSWPATSGWDMALITAIACGGNVAWASLMNPVSHGELKERGFTPRQINQLHVWETHRPCVNSVCAWRYEFLRKAGGLNEPSAFYGGLECSMWGTLNEQRKKWVFLNDFWEQPAFKDEVDPAYREYKWIHAGHDRTQSWPGDFESFCKHKGLIT